jgi:drug/metabolite transporter (DMT)-like permease
MLWYAYAILVAALWGFYALLESKIVKQYHPLFLFVIGGICYGVCALIILVIKWKTLVPTYMNAGSRIIAIASIGSLCGVALANYLFLLALESAPAPNIIMALAYSAPIFTILGSILLLQYKVCAIEIIGMILTFCGVGLVTYGMRT